MNAVDSTLRRCRFGQCQLAMLGTACAKGSFTHSELTVRLLNGSASWPFAKQE